MADSDVVLVVHINSRKLFRLEQLMYARAGHSQQPRGKRNGHAY
jgi:hypothetical protein